MPQSEDKIALDALGLEIYQLQEQLRYLERDVVIKNSKLEQLIDRKKSMENYLNSDKTLTI